MKKICVLMIVLLSYCLMYFSYDQININQGTCVFSENIVLEENLHKKAFYIIINFQKDDMNELYDSLIQLADEKDLSLLIAHSMKNEDGELNYDEKMIYSKNKNILNGFHIDKKEDIDFSNTHLKKYYSTEIDSQSSGYVRILDNSLFIQSGSIFRFRNFAYIKEMIKIDNPQIFMQVYANDQQEFYDFIEKLQGVNSQILIETMDMDTLGSISPDKSVIQSHSLKIVGLMALSMLAILVSLIVKNNRKYMIEKMMGISSIRIIFKEFGVLLFSVFIAFSLSSLFFFYCFCKEINDLSIVLFEQVIVSSLYCFVILFVIFIFAVIFVQMISSMKYLHSQIQLNRLLFVQMVMKVIIVLLMIVPFLDALHTSLPYFKNYIAALHMKDDAHNYYYLSSIPTDDRRIYKHFIQTEDYIEFNSFYWNSVMNDITVASAKENGYYDNLYKYPFISANKKVIAGLSLKDEYGNDIDVDSLTYKNALIPLEYKDKDLSSYQLSLKEIIYIQNYGKVYNYKFEDPFYLTNPMIMVSTEDSTDIQIMSLRFKGDNAKDVQEKIYQVSRSDHNELSITSSQYKMEFYTILLEKNLIEMGFILIMYFFISFVIMIQTFCIYINEEAKRLSVLYMMGYSQIKRYATLIICNFISYIAVFIGLTRLDVRLNDAFYCLLVIIIIEALYHYISLKIYEKKHMQNILKGEL